MNTTTHLLIAEAAFRRKSVSFSGWAAALGGVSPDGFLALFLASSLGRGVDGNTMWTVEYYREPWATLGAISNSIPLWAAILVAGLGLMNLSGSEQTKKLANLLWVFAASGLCHIFIDFLTHADDAHQHFWPVTEWRFHSPFSYWDPAHNAGLIRPLEGLTALGSIAILWRQSSALLKAALVLLAILATAMIVAGFFL